MKPREQTELKLPSDILYKISTYLTITELLNCDSICKEINTVSTSNDIWQNFITKPTEMSEKKETKETKETNKVAESNTEQKISALSFKSIFASHLEKRTVSPYVGQNGQEYYASLIYKKIGEEADSQTKTLSGTQKDFASRFLTRIDKTWAEKLIIAPTPADLFALVSDDKIRDLSNVAQLKALLTGHTPEEVRTLNLSLANYCRR